MRLQTAAKPSGNMQHELDNHTNTLATIVRAQLPTMIYMHTIIYPVGQKRGATCVVDD